MSILGLDIGGANIKAADDSGRAMSRAFPIWKTPERLSAELVSLLGDFPQTEHIAVTMTAELADCFDTKSDGVHFILTSIESSCRAIDSIKAGVSVAVWTTSGCFLSIDDARLQPMLVAAANWNALATWCGRLVPDGAALLIDIGTTTTDIIPMVDGKIEAIGRTDPERLRTGELSYSGVRRTPVYGLANAVPVETTCAAISAKSFSPQYSPLAAELFATTLDIYLLLGDIAPNPADRDTANGMPATVNAAHQRLARMLCCDREDVSLENAVSIARFLAEVQHHRLAGALDRVARRLPGLCQHIVVSGSGSFLARRLVAECHFTKAGRVISLDHHLSPELSESACAYAVARLLADKASGSLLPV